MVTFIFGAGASIPFFDGKLSTANLTTHIKDPKRWNEMLQKLKYNWPKDKPLPEINIKEIMNVIDAVCHSKKNANFEEIIEVIDKVATYRVADSPSDDLFNLAVSVIDPKLYKKKCFDQKESDRSWFFIPFLSREIIAMTILDLERTSKSHCYESLKQAQEKFIIQAAGDKEPSSIVSLNYDNVIVESARHLSYEVGKVLDGTYVFRLDAEKLLTEKRLAYFPHGHIRFVFKEDDDVEYYCNSGNADENRWKALKEENIISPVIAIKEDSSYNFNTFMVTGCSKDSILNHAPYSYYYQRLAIDCKNSQTIYTIGYSFRDAHINRFLMSFLHLSPQNHLIVIDWHPDDVNLLDERNVGSIFDFIRNYTKTTIGITCGGDSPVVGHLYKDGEERINKTGFGQIFKQVYYYKKGYSCFLKEFPMFINP